ncbi:MAG TPA: hypothetical protein VIA06_08345 [Candidatus Dormibacteraeota bacterium]|nr:hypothetical protein [Candidatus Dormibacteraeota bacterium]
MLDPIGSVARIHDPLLNGQLDPPGEVLRCELLDRCDAELDDEDDGQGDKGEEQAGSGGGHQPSSHGVRD